MALFYVAFHWMEPIIELWKDKQKEGWTVKGVIAFVVCICLVLFVAHKEFGGASTTSTQNLTATNPIKSPILQVGTASNVEQKIDYSSKSTASTGGVAISGNGNVTMVGTNNTMNSQTGTNNQFSNLKFFGNFQGQIIPANIGTFNYEPIITNPPDTELRAWITNISETAAFASNGILLTTKQLSQLTDVSRAIKVALMPAPNSTPNPTTTKTTEATSTYQPPEVAAIIRRAFEKSSFGIPASVAPDDFYLMSRVKCKNLPFWVRLNCLLHLISYKFSRIPARPSV